MSRILQLDGTDDKFDAVISESEFSLQLLL